MDAVREFSSGHPAHHAAILTQNETQNLYTGIKLVL